MKAYKSASPCLNCAERRIGCHSECKKYIDWTNDVVIIDSTFITPAHDRQLRNAIVARGSGHSKNWKGKITIK